MPRERMTYDFRCLPVGIPRVWAIKRDQRVPLGKRGTHGNALERPHDTRVVYLSSSVVLYNGRRTLEGTPAIGHRVCSCVGL